MDDACSQRARQRIFAAIEPVNLSFRWDSRMMLFFLQ